MQLGTLQLQGLLYLLADEDHGIIDKTHTALAVILPGSLHQANISLTDQVVNRQTLVLILSGNGNHKPQIRLNQFVQGTLVAGMNAGCQSSLFVFRQKRLHSNLVKIDIQCIVNHIAKIHIFFENQLLSDIEIMFFAERKSI